MSKPGVVPIETETFFHGGVPGLEAGDRILSAADLKIRVEYHLLGNTYDPSFVYFSTDQVVASAYAGRYESPEGPFPGDLYVIRPEGEVSGDPDYPDSTCIFKAKSAVVTAIVERGIRITAREKLRRLGANLAWETGRPCYDAAGHLLPSAEMERNGVDREYLALFDPWTPIEGVNRWGQPVIGGKPSHEALLRRIPSLNDGSHLIATSAPRSYLCTTCGVGYSHWAPAAIHQMGEETLKLIGSTMGWWPPGTPLELFNADVVIEITMNARADKPDQWGWLPGKD